MPKVDSAARDKSCIEHIFRYCEQLNEALTEIDFSKERFLQSHTYQNAIAMCILQLGELTKQLSLDFQQSHHQIPWSLISKTRDMYAHHYGVADFEMVWATAINDIPILHSFCRQQLYKQE